MILNLNYHDCKLFRICFYFCSFPSRFIQLILTATLLSCWNHVIISASVSGVALLSV